MLNVSGQCESEENKLEKCVCLHLSHDPNPIQYVCLHLSHDPNPIHNYDTINKHSNIFLFIK